MLSTWPIRKFDIVACVCQPDTESEQKHRYIGLLFGRTSSSGNVCLLISFGMLEHRHTHDGISMLQIRRRKSISIVSNCKIYYINFERNKFDPSMTIEIFYAVAIRSLTIREFTTARIVHCSIFYFLLFSPSPHPSLRRFREIIDQIIWTNEFTSAVCCLHFVPREHQTQHTHTHNEHSKLY